MPGKLIVCEGLDCSGKTTAINEVINLKPDYVYSKGIGSGSYLGKIARRFPSTPLFLLELIWNSCFYIIPQLKKDKTILQDRYDISISSFVPGSQRTYNRLLIKYARILIPKPDAIVYFYLPLEERIKRLIEKGKKYELLLAKNPEMIILREKEYEKWYDYFNGPKIKIETKQNGIKQTAKILEDFVNGI